MDQNLYFQRGIQIITKINEVTPQAYLVGGVVRDYLLQIPFNDIDIATSATPEQILELFPEAKDEFLEYGCITLKEDGMVFEITTFREESYNKKSRKPSEIHFSKKLLDDIQRRDFTINALAMPKSMVLVDLVGGEKDLKSKVVRIIGKPKKRFKEDPLRILRGLSLVAKLNFTIEKKTLRGMIACKKSLAEISNYKLTGEFANILNLPYGKKAFKIMSKNNLFINDRVFSKWIRLVLKKYDKLSTLDKFALLYKLEGKVPDNTCFTKETISRINEIINVSKHLELNNVTAYDVYKNDLETLRIADLLNSLLVKKYKQQIKTINKLANNLVIKSREELSIRPRNIIEIAGTTGDFVGKIMDDIEKEVVLKKIENSFDVLFVRIKQLLEIYNKKETVEEQQVIVDEPQIIEENIEKQHVVEQPAEVQEVVEKPIVQQIPDYVIPEEPVIEEVADEPVYVPEVEVDEMPEDIPYEDEIQQDVDIEKLLAEYKVEYGKMLDKRMISLIDENTPLEEIDRIKESIASSSRLLTIKANPKFEILMERGLI